MPLRGRSVLDLRAQAFQVPEAFLLPSALALLAGQTRPLACLALYSLPVGPPCVRLDVVLQPSDGHAASLDVQVPCPSGPQTVEPSSLRIGFASAKDANSALMISPQALERAVGYFDLRDCAQIFKRILISRGRMLKAQVFSA